jgi:hypothetical protein
VSGFVEPAYALETNIVLTARQWRDDDPDDLPLTFAFSYLTTAAGVAEGVLTDSAQLLSLGPRSSAKTTVWQKPPAGNFTVVLSVHRRSRTHRNLWRSR